MAGIDCLAPGGESWGETASVVVRNAFFYGRVRSKSVVNVVWCVGGRCGECDVPEFGGWGSVSNNDGVVVGLNGYCIFGEMGCASVVTQLADG